MSKLSNLSDFLTSLANSFRSELGGTALINPQDFDGKVDEVYDKGRTVGYNYLYDVLWDSLQASGTRTNYMNGFSNNGFNALTFKPKYSMLPTNARAMFKYCNANISLIDICTEQNITIDFSNCTNMQEAFYGSNFTKLPVIDMSSVAYSASSQCFDEMINLISIQKVKFGENVTYAPYTFRKLTALNDVIFEGVLTQSGMLFNLCIALSHDSLLSLISVLKDYSGTTTTKTITFGATNIAKLSDAEIAVATTKGWTIA